MSDSQSNSRKSLSLEEFIALNDEIASLLKAGVPLNLGLSGFSNSVSGQLSRVSADLAKAVDRGESLGHALDAIQTETPVAYRAILEAGMESGRLSEAVESLADHARSLQSTRDQIKLATIYPTIVVAFAYGLFWFFAAYLAPRANLLTTQLTDRKTGWTLATDRAAELMSTLGLYPLILLFGFLVWIQIPHRFSSRIAVLNFRGLQLLPGIRQARRFWILSDFSEFAARLMQYDVPAPRALQLAAETTGNQQLIADAGRISADLNTGESLGTSIDSAKSIPSLMKWMLKVADRQSAMICTFRQLADHYRRKAIVRTERIQLIFPIAATIFIGGGITLLYSLAIFAPIAELLHQLGQETFSGN